MRVNAVHIELTGGRCNGGKGERNGGALFYIEALCNQIVQICVHGISGTVLKNTGKFLFANIAIELVIFLSHTNK